MKKLALAGLSLVWLAVLYAVIDVDAMLLALRDVDLARLAGAIALLLALVGASAARLALLARASDYPITLHEAVAATFAANALNVALPAKLGDMLKCTVMAQGRRERVTDALRLCVWEKFADLASLFLLAAAALALAGGAPLWALAMLGLGALLTLCLLAPGLMRAAAALLRRVGGARLAAPERFATRMAAVLETLRGRPAALLGVLALTVLIWAGHLAQICLMLWALGVTGDAAFWLTVAALMPAAIVAGLAPVSFAGLGARDAALVAVLSGLVSAPIAAALGLLFFLRYLAPGLVGAVFLPRFAASIAALAAQRAEAR